MKSMLRTVLPAAMAAAVAAVLTTGCSGTGSPGMSKMLGLEYYVSGGPDGPGGPEPGNPVYPKDPEVPEDPGKPVDPGNPAQPGQDIPKTGVNGIHPLFSGTLGMPVSALSIGAVDPDPTGQAVTDDYDGDGIPNDLEGVNNPYVADYPQVVTGITGSVTMKVEVLESSLQEDHVETVEFTEENDTIKNSMEDWHYNQINKLTTPYVSKESAESVVYNKELNTKSIAIGLSEGNSKEMGGSGESPYGGGSLYGSLSNTEGWNLGVSKTKDVETMLKRATMSEKTLFPTIDHIDNLDRNGKYFTSDNVKNIMQNYRASETLKSTTEYGPYAGVVVASLYIKNLSVNIPVHVSNIWCTLSFRTPAGEFIPVRTFRLRDSETWEVYEQDVYGGESFGPYTVKVTEINTADMKKALANAYVPQIEVISYDMTPVLNSNYHPGVDNYKIVEENAKGRTAQINIIGKNTRQSYRVCAFDVDNGVFSPGISLKKALYNILNNRMKHEMWTADESESPRLLTVADDDLWWRNGAADNAWNRNNREGNRWDRFETYIKSYNTLEPEAQADGTVRLKNVEHTIETIKRIGVLEKYNPFDPRDNFDFNEQELLPQKELSKMKYWIILHNGKFFNGDINDPIWVGDKYEIIFFEVEDFASHFNNYIYTPLQSMETRYLITNWNRLSDGDEFARSLYMGKLVGGDVVRLEIDLEEYRCLFDPAGEGREFGSYFVNDSIINAPIWNDFRYSFQGDEDLPEGVPQEFTHEALGRVNQIALKIGESKNARSYRVSFWRTAEEESSAREVPVTPAQLLENDGYVFINRKTLASNGLPVGPIESGAYRVRVTAYGMKGTSVLSRSSSSGSGGVTAVTVTDAAAGALPDPATYSLYGSLDRIQVTISEAEGENPAEYYRIRVMGPESCGSSEFIDIAGQPDGGVNGVTGHAGINVIPVDSANHCGSGSSGSDDLTEEDVFRVKVYAINSANAGTDGNPANEEPDEASAAQVDDDVEKVIVPYDRFRAQKPENCVPVKRNDLFDPRELDLEANFNDGSGWFKLKLSSNDVDPGSKVIQCNYTSYIDSVNKKVVIYFQPPAGSETPQNTLYNVFRGGRDEVDLYIRTSANPEYRDTLWLKPNVNTAMDFSQDLRFIAIQSTEDNTPSVKPLPYYDPVYYWMTNPNTDASLIENFTINGSRVTAHNGSMVNLGTTVPAGDFEVVVPRPADTSEFDNGKSSFFFSPVKQVVFRIKGSIVSENIPSMMSARNYVDAPKFRVIPGDKAVCVYAIDSQYAESFRVYWRRGATADMSEDLDALPWSQAAINADSATAAWITGLDINQVYTIAVVAVNGISRSTRLYRQVKTITQAEAFQLADPGWYSNGAGYFSTTPVQLLKSSGAPITPPDDFTWGSSILPIFDTQNSGSLDSANRKSIRIVNAGVNVASSTGFSLVPVAQNLSQWFSPPSDQCYIDPLRGLFALPRPSYWCRFETLTDITDPVIQDCRYPPSYQTLFNQQIGSVKSGKFGNSLFCEGNGGAIYPFGNNALNCSRGTLSVWIRLTGQGEIRLVSLRDGAFVISASCSSSGGIMGNTSPVQRVITLTSNGSTVKSGNVITENAWHHIYAVWDQAGALGDSKKARVWVDGVEVLFLLSGAQLPDLSSSVFVTYMSSAWACSCQIDNLKIFRGSVIDDPSWEYNNGEGRERALHRIYGPSPYAEFDYRPRVTSEGGGGVGYLCRPH